MATATATKNPTTPAKPPEPLVRVRFLMHQDMQYVPLFAFFQKGDEVSLPQSIAERLLRKQGAGGSRICERLDPIPRELPDSPEITVGPAETAASETQSKIQNPKSKIGTSVKRARSSESPVTAASENE
jgi:hypothetical protein